MHPGTVDGPGDAWDEQCYDSQPPVAGTPYVILAPVHETAGKELDDRVYAKVLEDFKHWLDERRQQDVSAVFHETVAKVGSLLSLSLVRPDDEYLVEQVAMGVLGKKEDEAPGINWYCNRQWRVNDVRAAVRRALEATGIIQNTSLAPVNTEQELDF